MPKFISVVLSGSGGELDRMRVEHQEDQDRQSALLQAAIATFVLSPGDTITIAAEAEEE